MRDAKIFLFLIWFLLFDCNTRTVGLNLSNHLDLLKLCNLFDLRLSRSKLLLMPMLLLLLLCLGQDKILFVKITTNYEIEWAWLWDERVSQLFSTFALLRPRFLIADKLICDEQKTATTGEQHSKKFLKIFMHSSCFI